MPTSIKDMLASANASVPRVDRDQAMALIKDKNALVVDVRETEEFSTGHLPGAKHVPRGYLESRIEGVVPDHSQRVILYCASGGRSALAGKALQDLGYQDVRNLGAFKDWAEKGGPVEKV